MKISELINITNAEVLGSFDEDFDVEISTDTRTVKKGDFYLPLKGASFDGENFINQAFEKGAIGSFCTREHPLRGLLLKVPDALIAYLQLANYLRNKNNYKVVAITGSSGKTTTKEMLYSVFATQYKTHKTYLKSLLYVIV